MFKTNAADAAVMIAIVIALMTVAITLIICIHRENMAGIRREQKKAAEGETQEA